MLLADPLQMATGGRPLSALTFALLTKHHGEAMRNCSVDARTLARFLLAAEDQYLDNPYVSALPDVWIE